MFCQFEQQLLCKSGDSALSAPQVSCAAHICDSNACCRLHFQLKKGVIQQQLQDWLVAAGKHLAKDTVTAIRSELEKL